MYDKRFLKPQSSWNNAMSQAKWNHDMRAYSDYKCKTHWALPKNKIGIKQGSKKEEALQQELRIKKRGSTRATQQFDSYSHSTVLIH